MTREERSRLVLVILTALGAGGVVGGGIGAHLLSPAMGVTLAVLIGVATGSEVRRAILEARRDASANKD